MEDAHVCIDDIQKETEFSEIPTKQKHSIYGVYDGTFMMSELLFTTWKSNKIWNEWKVFILYIEIIM